MIAANTKLVSSTDLLTALYKMSQLRHLHLEHCFGKFGCSRDLQRGAAASNSTLAAQTEALSNLTTLRIRETATQSAIVSQHPHLASLIRSCRSFNALKEVQLHGFVYDEHHVHDIACSLSKLTGLEKLDMSLSQVSTAGSLQLASAFQSLGALTELRVDRLFVTSTPSPAWYSSLEHLTSLQARQTSTRNSAMLYILDVFLVYSSW